MIDGISGKYIFYNLDSKINEIQNFKSCAIAWICGDVNHQGIFDFTFNVKSILRKIFFFFFQEN